MYAPNNDNSYSDSPFDLYSQFSTSTTINDPDISHPNMNIGIEASNLVNNGTCYCYNGTGSRDSSHVGSPSNSLASYGNLPVTTTNQVIMERSSSSQSLHKTGAHSLLGSYAESSDDGSAVNNYMMRRKQRAESPLSISSENSMIIEGMTKATRYSPEEKKERIERYRSKKNQRNFNKKIQYACRKTLADSRPRIKGRFARNDEIPSPTSAMTTENHIFDHCLLNDQWSSHQHLEYDGEEGESWAHLLEYTFTCQTEED